MRLEYFRMIDRIVEMHPAQRLVRAECHVPAQSPVFEGHFPGHPLLPGVLMIETMAQAGGWLVLAILQFERMPFLAQVKEAKMRSFVAPGQTLIAEARLLHDGSGYAVASANLSSDGKRVADIEITYRVTPFPTPAFRDMMIDVGRQIGMPEPLLPVLGPHSASQPEAAG